MESLTEDMVQAAEAIIDEVSQTLPAQRAALSYMFLPTWGC